MGESQESLTRKLAEDLQAEYGISEEQIDQKNFGLFDHVTGQPLVATALRK